MDVASSPYQPPNDIDLDLDPFRDPSVLEDEMIDYQDDLVLQDDGPQDIAIDDIMDQASNAGHEFDYNMDSSLEQPEQTRDDDDDDVLYEDEDEDESEIIPQDLDHENNDDQPTANHTLKFIAEDDAVGESIDGNFDEHVELQTDDRPTTQAPHPEDHQDASASGDNLVQIQGNPGFQPPQPAAQSPPAHPEDDLPIEGESGETDLLPDDSEYVHLEPLDYRQENDPEPDAVDRNLSPLPHENEQTISDTQHEEAPESKGIHVDPTREVHPVTLVYLEEEMSLFPPLIGDGSSVYFLSDSNLASQPLDKLLAACREILTGTLEHDDELVLDIPGLGLHICEDSKYSAQITLASVLEIYLKLCHNDPDDQCQPLYCHLSSRVSLASQYAYLSSAGDEGKTYAEIVADHVDTPEEASTHMDDQVHSPVTQDASLEATEHELPPSPKITGHTDLSQVGPDLPHVEEDLFKEVDEDPHAQTDGVQALNKEPSEEEPPLIVQDFQPDHLQEEVGGFDTVDYPDQEDTLQHSHHHESPAAESSSSHTVEAYYDDTGNHEAYEEDAKGEDLFSDTNQETADLLDQQQDTEYESGYGDEELFVQDNVGADVVGAPSISLPEEGDARFFPATIEQKSLKSDVADASLDFLEDEADSGIADLPKDHDLVGPSPPITPFKPNVSKRKAEVDDDLDFLEIGTPEPKRRRSS
ncbi:hypothetical protein LTR84_001977 [Exophiala bonariae]|uniref:Uncharacterized protein n=1 Tax=Exophiala bonariae TaxID=1690606 RepID=A0AAV9NBV5_9EURO|nr:hypothetical protein LTR84_001977 [Exophiala bonariae]